MTTQFTRLLTAAAVVAAMCPGADASGSPRPPNVVFILADDIGYGDFGCYGAKLATTPNVDRLAKQGRRFTDAHSPAATCTPTRYALLTGRYAFRHPPGARILPGDAPLSIRPGEPTLPALMKKAGYTTGVVGKWHLGLGGEGGPDWNGEIKRGPLDVGFDNCFILPATGDRVPCVYVEDRRVVGLDPKDPIRVRYGQKVGDEPTGKENPNLLKLKPTHGHDMTIVNGISRIGYMAGGKSARWVDEDMADTFTRKAVGFIERNKDRPFFLYFATHDIHVPRVPHPRFKGTSKCGTRGDAIQQFDWCVGEVMAALDRLKLTDDTLVIVTSDNGGVMDDGYEDFGSLDHKCNGVLRGKKGTLYEGGHRVPFIARWPGHVPAGSECGELIAHLDMAATFAVLAGVPLPADGAPDSFNVLDALLGRPHGKATREAAVFHTGGTAGPFTIRQGSWKYIQPGGRGPRAMEAAKDIEGGTIGGMLFNLADDLTESKNLAARHPDKVKELAALLEVVRKAPGTRPR
jgi:arylsulfatase A-like enzyme